MTKNLYSEPLTGFSKNAHIRLADHQNKAGTIHQKTMPIYDNFMKIMKGKMLVIKDQVKLKPDQIIFNELLEQLFFVGAKHFLYVVTEMIHSFNNSSLLEFPSVNVDIF